MHPVAIVCCTLPLLGLVWVLYSVLKSRCSDGHHSFEARYSEESTPPVMDAHGAFMTSYVNIEALTARKNTYIHDICIHCGKIAKGEPKPTYHCTGNYEEPGATSQGSQQ